MSTDQPYEEEFAPDPRASQNLAAKKRQRGDAQPTLASAASTVPMPPHYKVIAFAVGAVLLVSVFALLVAKYPASSPKPLATPQADTRATDAALVLGLPVTPQGYSTSTPVLVETIDAYAAPDGAVLGPVELSRVNAGQAVARCRADWVQVRVEGSGPVWFPLPNMSLRPTGPDLCVVPTLAPQTGRGMWTPPTLPPADDGRKPDGVDAIPTPAPAEPTLAANTEVLRIRSEDDCNSEHGRCTPPCTAEHGRCAKGDE